MAFFPMLSGNADARTKKRSHIFLAVVVVSLLQTLLAGPAFAQVNRDQWMGDLADDPRYAVDSPMDQTLAEFIFPGTSNSGSYGTKLLPACDSCRKEPLRFYTDTPLLGIVAGLFLQDWAITQTANIEGQLSLGARVLDLRFFRVTPADNQNMQGFIDLLISLGIGDVITLPATDGYYTHNTFAGPSSTEVFQHVRNFLVDGTGVPIPGREREIIILNFSEMLKGNGEMTADDLNTLFNQLIITVVGEQYFAESSLTDSATLADLQVAGKQIIVSYDGSVAVSDLDPAIQPYIWPKIVAQGFDDINPPGTSFPRADTWNTEGLLFGLMKTLALERVNQNATSQLFQMNVSMGADDASDFPDMVSRRLLCNLPTVYSDVRAYYDPLDLFTDLLGIKSPPEGTTDPAEFEQLIEKLIKAVKDSIQGALGLAAFEAFMDDVLGFCPAINDDWDRFTSLEDVAGFTNPKLLPSLVGLPRDTVNIVLVDHYPGEFTDEVNKLNQGATRVSVVITKVEERECHDCVPFTALRLSNPDYYPEITFFPKNVSGSIVPDVWGYYESPVDVVEANTPDFGIFQESILPPNLSEAGMTQHESHWGGPWLETSGTRITPTWRAFRALSPDTPQVDVKIRIWDQDNNICYSIAPLYTWCGWDDLSRIDGSNTSVTQTVESWVGTQPKTDDAVPTVLAKPVRNVVGGPSTNCSLDDLTSWPPTCSINLDSSVVHYGVYSCLWAPVPGEDFNQFFACDPPSANAAPTAVVDILGIPDGVAIDEGFKLEASGRLSFDPNDCPPDGHPNYSPGCINYDILGNWIDEVVEYEWDCNHDPVPVCLNDAIADDYNPTGGSACPIGYTETSFVPGRGCRKPTILAEAHPYCDFLPEPCTWGGVPSKIRFAAYDGPADQQVALRVTDRAGKKSIPTVASFLVDNSEPIITGHEVVQEPGTGLVTSTIEFIDYSADDSQFLCSVQVNGPGDFGLFLLDGAEVEGESYFDDNFGVTAVSYRCSLTFPFQFLPGVYTFLPEVEDKDFAKSPGVQATHFSRVLTFVPPAVTNAGDSGAGSLRDAIANASPGDVLGFDLSLSGQTITLVSGAIILDKDLTIDASSLPDGLTISGNDTSRVFEKSGPARTAVLKGLTITEGRDDFWGGCIYQTSGELTLIDSTVHNCFTQGEGGGIYSSFNNAGLFLENSTITGNLSLTAGGIYIGGPPSGSRFSMVHSTISGNTAVSTAGVGGLVYDVPICVWGMDDLCLTIENSIIAGNFHNDTNWSPDISINSQVASVTITGNNLIGNHWGVQSYFPAGLLVGTPAVPIDPYLHPLKDNGGPTPTLLPRTGSLAINQAETFADSPSHDQRGFLRLVDGYSDLGAVEKQAFDVDDNDDDGFGNPTDNCVNIANPDQLDFDNDGDGNVCDTTATITILGDGSPGSLRDVIDFVPSGVVIDFDPAASGGSIVLTGGDLVVDKELTIDASSLPLGLTLSGNNASRVFDVTAIGNLTLNGLTIRDGQADVGGCIQNLGVLDFVDSTVTGCSATDSGGAISNSGSMTMTNTTVSGNNQVGIGAILNAGNATLIHSTIADNHSSGDPASASGGIGNFDVLNIENSIVAGNTGGVNPDIFHSSGTINASGSNLVGDNSSVTAEFPAGPLVGTAGAPLDPGLVQLLNFGGPNPTMLPISISPAVDSAITTLNSPMNDQRGFTRPAGAANDLGAVERQTFDVDDIDGDGVFDSVDNCPTVSNLDQLDFDSDGEGNVCDATATLTILGDGSTGSLRDVIGFAPSGAVIDFDPAASGGSIVLTGGDLVVDKELTIDASSLPLGLTLSGNNASRVFDVTAAGNLALNGLTIRDGQADIGGCIQNHGVLDIVDSTVTGCSALGGGGIYSNGSMTMTNSTVSGNDQDFWGAIFIFDNATLVHSTISDNHSLAISEDAVGGIGNFGVVNIENSIVAGNTGSVTPDIRAGGVGTINAFGSNLVGDNSGVTTEFPAGPLVGTTGAPLDPLLNLLGDYGGPTPTMTPLVDSPVVDAAVVTGNTPGADQRGVVRPQGAGNDLGAVERQVSDVDVDTDGDTVPDAIDNCPADANTNQRDTDGDGIGDVCDVLLTVVPLPDISSDGIEDVAVMREGSILAEIRSGANGALQKTLTFLNGNFSAIGAIAVPDSDGNGVAELAVLAVRNSDGRIIVEVRNITGAEAPRSIWFAANHTAVDIAVVDDDADNNGVVELAVLSRRNSDGRGLVEVKNAFGATNPVALWAGPGMTSSHVEVLGDKDANGIPEIAILSTRNNDGFIVAEIKNAAGAAMPTAVWFAQGHTAIDMTAVDDKDGNGIPEVAVLSRRNSDGRNVVEVKNAAGATAPSSVWLAGGFTATDVKQVHDSDSNGVPEIAALSVRDSDGRILVEVKNAFGPTNLNAVWYSPGYAASGLAILGDTDANGAEESLVLMIRDSDGRILVQGRNAAGSAAPKQYWFSP